MDDVVSVGVRELKAHWSRYGTIVKKGGTVTITRRGEPVAELRPIVPATASARELGMDTLPADLDSQLGRQG